MTSKFNIYLSCFYSIISHSNNKIIKHIIMNEQIINFITLTKTYELYYLYFIIGFSITIIVGTIIIDKQNKYISLDIRRLLLTIIIAAITFIIPTYIFVIKKTELDNGTSFQFLEITYKLNLKKDDYMIYSQYNEYENMQLYLCLNNIGNVKTHKVCQKKIDQYKSIMNYQERIENDDLNYKKVKELL